MREWALALAVFCCGCTVDSTGQGKLPVPIVFVSRHPGNQASPSSLDAYYDLPGAGPHSRLRPASPGRLMTLDENGLLRVLVDGAMPGDASLYLEDVSSPSVSWDGKTIVFAGLHARMDEMPWDDTAASQLGAWRIYTIGSDGIGLKQLPFADEPVELEDFDRQLGPAADALREWDDFDPVFLPGDDHVVFASTRWRGTAPVLGVRTSNLFVGAVAGGAVARITAERGGAERPVIDPQTGRVAYSRWLSLARLPSDDDTTLGPDPTGEAAVPDIYWRNEHIDVDFAPTEHLFRQRDGLTALGVATSSMARNAWQLLSVNPDGSDPKLVTGYRRDDVAGEVYGGAFAPDGSFIGQFFPSLTVVDIAGYGGIRRHPAGAGLPVGLRGVTAIPTGDVWIPLVARSLYAAEPSLLPDGRVLYSQTQAASAEAPTIIDDRTQDYGIYVLSLDTGVVEFIFDLPDTAELHAQVMVARTPPPSLALPTPSAALPPRATTLTSSDAAALDDATALSASGQPGALDQDGTATFTAANVYANAPVDVPIVSAPAVGSASTLRMFADWQRHSPGPYAVIDWPRKIGDTPVDATGFASLTVPARVPLFGQLRGSTGNVTLTDGSAHPITDARAQELGPVGAAPGERRVCLGCHAGHSLITSTDPAFSNLAPGAVVNADTAVGAGAASTLVDRVAQTLADAHQGWRSTQIPVEIRLSFPVPIVAKSVVLWEQTGGALHVPEATIRLYDDSGALVGSPVVTGLITAQGLTIDVTGGSAGVVCRTVSVTIDQASGTLDGVPFSSLGEIEVIASGSR